MERNPEFAAVISSLVDLAGLGELVKVIVGPSDTAIKRLHDSGALGHIDLMFLDHYKPAYTADLKLCEQLGLVTPGSVLAADNVIKPGNPPYLEYVRSSVADKTAALERQARADGSGVDARFADRTSNQYAKREGQEKLDVTVKGNPKLVYESKLVNSYEPTGEPVRTARAGGGAHLLTKLHRTAWRLRGASERRSRDGMERDGTRGGRRVSVRREA